MTDRAYSGCVHSVEPGVTPMLKSSATAQDGTGPINMETKRWREVVADLRKVGAIDDSDTVHDAEQLRSVLDPVKEALPERHRRVLAMYQTDNMTLAEIGAVLGVDPSRVAQIRKRALQMMASRLKAKCVNSATPTEAATIV